MYYICYSENPETDPGSRSITGGEFVKGGPSYLQNCSVCVYIYGERERARDINKEMSVYIYIYIYVYIAFRYPP